jgi:hypothetical protein
VQISVIAIRTTGGVPEGNPAAARAVAVGFGRRTFATPVTTKAAAARIYAGISAI